MGILTPQTFPYTSTPKHVKIPIIHVDLAQVDVPQGVRCPDMSGWGHVKRSIQHNGRLEMGWTGRAGVEVPPTPSRAPSLCPATVCLTPSARLNGICNRQ